MAKSWKEIQSATVMWPDLSAHGVQLMLSAEKGEEKWQYGLWMADTGRRYSNWLREQGFEQTRHIGLWKNDSTKLLADQSILNEQFPRVLWKTQRVGDLLAETGPFQEPEEPLKPLPLADYSSETTRRGRTDKALLKLQVQAAIASDESPKRPLMTMRSLMNERISMGVNETGEQVFLDVMGQRHVSTKDGFVREDPKEQDEAARRRFLRGPASLYAAANDLWNRPNLEDMDARQAAQVLDMDSTVKAIRPLVTGLAKTIMERPTTVHDAQSQFDAIFGIGAMNQLRQPGTPPAAWMLIEAFQRAMDEELGSVFGQWQESNAATPAQVIYKAEDCAANRPVLWRLNSARPVPLALSLIVGREARLATALYGEKEDESLVTNIRVKNNTPLGDVFNAISRPSISTVLSVPGESIDARSVSGLMVNRMDHLAALLHLNIRPANAQSILLLEQDRGLDAGEVSDSSKMVLEHIAKHYEIHAWDMSPDLLAEGGESPNGLRVVIVGARRQRALRNAPVEGLSVLESFGQLFEQFETQYGLNEKLRLHREQKEKAAEAGATNREIPQQLDLFGDLIASVSNSPTPVAVAQTQSPQSVIQESPIVSTVASQTSTVESGANPADIPQAVSDEAETAPIEEPASQESVADVEETASTVDPVEVVETLEEPQLNVPTEVQEPQVPEEMEGASQETGRDVADAVEDVQPVQIDAETAKSADEFESPTEAAILQDVDEERLQVAYKPMSQVGEASAMVPRNLAAPIRSSLARLVRESGQSVDNFVATQLQWTESQLRERLSPEQVDAVALNIWNLNSGIKKNGAPPAFLLGDSTGVGKGRVLATMASWAKKNDIPVLFVTENATLFRDFYRDLKNIREDHNFRNPLLLSTTKLFSEEGELIATPPKQDDLRKIFTEDTLPKGFDCILASYSQFNRDPATELEYSRHKKAVALSEKMSITPQDVIKAFSMELPTEVEVNPPNFLTETQLSSFFVSPKEQKGVHWIDESLLNVDYWAAEDSLDLSETDPRKARLLAKSELDSLEIGLKDLKSKQKSGVHEVVNPFDAPKSWATDLIVNMPKPKDLINSSSSKRAKEAATKKIEDILSIKNGLSVKQLPADKDSLKLHISGFSPAVPKGATGPIEQVILQANLRRKAAMARIKFYESKNLQKDVSEYIIKSVPRLRSSWLLQPTVTRDQMILADESHNASSPTSKTGLNLSKVVMQSKAVTYSSATSIAKATNINFYGPLLPNYPIEELQGIMVKGGEPLQEALAQALAKSGMMIRRELSMEGIELRSVTAEKYIDRNINWNDRVADVLGACGGLYLSVRKMMEEFNDEALNDALSKIPKSSLVDKNGKPLSETAQHRLARKTASEMNSMTTMSRLFNINRLLQLAMNADKVIDESVEALNKGIKPVISLETTGESLLAWVMDKRNEEQQLQEIERQEKLEQAAASADEDAEATVSKEDEEDAEVISEQAISEIVDILATGSKNSDDPDLLMELDRHITMRDVLTRYVDDLCYVKKKVVGADGVKTTRIEKIDDQEVLGEVDRIKAELISNVPDIPVAGIDYIREGIEAHGYKVGEITGRKIKLDTDDEGNQYLRKREVKKSEEVRDSFNNGGLDVLILTRKGSTGISVHAGEHFADQRRRQFIEAQPIADVTKRTQAQGRVHRKGQVSEPIITLVSSGLAGDARLNLLLTNSMRKMSANVTGNSNNLNDNISCDYLNWVGNQCANEMLLEKPTLAAVFALDTDLLEEEMKRTKEIASEPSEEVRLYTSLGKSKRTTWTIDQITKRLPLLHADVQSNVIDEITNRFMERMNAFDMLGLNPLRTSSFPTWNAREVDSKEIVPARKNDIFSEPVYLKTLHVKEAVVPNRWQTIGCEEIISLAKEIASKPIEPHKDWKDDAAKKFESTKDRFKKSGIKMDQALSSYADRLGHVYANAAKRWDESLAVLALKRILPTGSIFNVKLDENNHAKFVVGNYLDETNCIELVEAEKMQKRILSNSSFTGLLGIETDSMRKAHTYSWEQVEGKINSDLASREVIIVSRPGEEAYLEKLNEWKNYFMEVKSKDVYRHVFTGDPFESARQSMLEGNKDVGKPANWRMENGLWNAGILLPETFSRAYHSRQLEILQARKRELDRTGKNPERAEEIAKLIDDHFKTGKYIPSSWGSGNSSSNDAEVLSHMMTRPIIKDVETLHTLLEIKKESLRVDWDTAKKYATELFNGIRDTDHLSIWSGPLHQNLLRMVKDKDFKEYLGKLNMEASATVGDLSRIYQKVHKPGFISFSGNEEKNFKTSFIVLAERGVETLTVKIDSVFGHGEKFINDALLSECISQKKTYERGGVVEFQFHRDKVETGLSRVLELSYELGNPFRADPLDGAKLIERVNEKAERALKASEEAQAQAADIDLDALLESAPKKPKDSTVMAQP